MRIPHSLAVRVAAPLALCGLLLTGCSGGGEPADQPGTTSQEGDAAPEGAAEVPDADADEGPAGDVEVGLGDVKVGTKIPDGFPEDLPLPEKAPTSVVTVGEGGGTVGGGWALNYDGVSMAEVEQMLQDAETAGYTLNGPFENGSSNMWNLNDGETGVLVVFSEQANLSITATKMP
ncbi:hypothetical protein [Microbacterium soli]